MKPVGVSRSQAVLMFTLLAFFQPKFDNACTKAVNRACPSLSSAAKFMSTPMRRMRSLCCARAESGHTAAGAAITLMKSRRRIEPNSQMHASEAVPAPQRWAAELRWRGFCFGLAFTVYRSPDVYDG